ncbi:MAG: hypothetical protein HYS41_06840 [Candidatus Omnitrophica bacterium]|nr:hypothetical protein [Candidatus Omnitrophota bacterium]
MRGKILALFLVITGLNLLMAQAAFAGMVGGPIVKAQSDEEELEDFYRIRVGVESDFVFDRDLTVPGGIGSQENSGQSHAARISYSPAAPVELYALAGVADLELESTDNRTLELVKEDFDFGFMYGGGISAQQDFLEEFWDLKIKMDAQFVQWESDLNQWSGSINGTFSTTTGNVRARAYHAAFTIGRTLEFGYGDWQVTPYLGGRWSQMTAEENDLDINLTAADDLSESGWRSDDHAGVVAGLSIQFKEDWLLGVEGRFVDETAVSAVGSYRF